MALHELLELGEDDLVRDQAGDVPLDVESPTATTEVNRSAHADTLPRGEGWRMEWGLERLSTSHIARDGLFTQYSLRACTRDRLRRIYRIASH